MEGTDGASIDGEWHERSYIYVAAANYLWAVNSNSRNI